MRRSMLRIPVLLLLTRSTTAAFLGSTFDFSLIPRQNAGGVCGTDTNLITCGNGHPPNWCCPKNTQCLTLNNTGTESVVCCPTGNTCSAIQVITCDISFQDASKYPSSSVHTANLTKPLPVCGDKCCPLGFSCQTSTNGQSPYCTMNDQTKTVSSASSTSTTTTSIATGQPTKMATETPEPAKKSNNTGKFVAAGIIPGLLIIAALIAGFLFWRRKKKSRRQISEPIPDPQTSARTDFLNTYNLRNVGLASPRPPAAQPSSRISWFSSHFRANRPGTSDSGAPLTPAPLKPGGGGRGTPWPTLSLKGSPRRQQVGMSQVGGMLPPPEVEMYKARRLPSIPNQPRGLSINMGDGSSATQLSNARYQPPRI